MSTLLEALGMPLLEKVMAGALGDLFQKVGESAAIAWSRRDQEEVPEDIRRALAAIRQDFGRRGLLSGRMADFLNAFYAADIFQQVVEDAYFKTRDPGVQAAFRTLYGRHFPEQPDDLALQTFRDIQHVAQKLMEWRLRGTPYGILMRSGYADLRRAATSFTGEDRRMMERFELSRSAFRQRARTYAALLPGSISDDDHLESLRRSRPWLFRLEADMDEVRQRYQERIADRTREISVFGPRGARISASFDDIYIRPALESVQVVISESGLRFESGGGGPSLETLISQEGLFVLLGHPGYGKTSATHWLLRQPAVSQARPSRWSFAVTLRKYAALRRTDPTLTLVDHIVALTCGILPELDSSLVRDTVLFTLFLTRPVVIFDGLDEILHGDERREITRQIAMFSNDHPGTTCIVTSRQVGYEPVSDLTQHFRLRSFDRDQIEAYTRKTAEHILKLDQGEARTFTSLFVAQAMERVAELAAMPLLLALMTVLYNDRGRELPDQRHAIYRECSQLLFETWDDARQINPDLPDKFRTQQLLVHLAARIYPSTELTAGVARSWLLGETASFFALVYGSDVSRSEYTARRFVDFITGRAWVFTQTGVDAFEFTHRTFLEYYFSLYLLEQSDTAKTLLDKIWPRISYDEWWTVAHLCLQSWAGESLNKSNRLVAEFEARLLTSPPLSLPAVTNFLAETLSYVTPGNIETKSLVRTVTNYAAGSVAWRDAVGSLLRRASKNRTTVLEGLLEGLQLGAQRGMKPLGPAFDFLYAVRLHGEGLLEADLLHASEWRSVATALSGQQPILPVGEPSMAVAKMLWDCFDAAPSDVERHVPQAWVRSVTTLGRRDWLGVDARTLLLRIGGHAPLSEAQRTAVIAMGTWALDPLFRPLRFPDHRSIVGGQFQAFDPPFLSRLFDQIETELLPGAVACLALMVDYAHGAASHDPRGLSPVPRGILQATLEAQVGRLTASTEDAAVRARLRSLVDNSPKLLDVVRLGVIYPTASLLRADGLS